MSARAKAIGVSSWILASLAALLAACSGAPEKTEEAQPAAAIETVQVSRGRVNEILQTLGTVEFDPGRLRTLTLVAGGQVLEVRVVAGQSVQRGDVLLVLGPPPADSVELQRARIDVEFAEKALVRTRRLLDERLATNQDVANAEKELDTARATLRSLGDGRMGAASELRAPGDAIVAQMLLIRGQVVAAGHEAAQLAPRDALAVAVGFETEVVPRLAAGLPVVIAPVYAAEDQAPVRAILSRLHSAVDPATQLVEGLIQLPDAPAWMASGMKVHVRVVVGESADALRVPRAALVERDGVTGVFVVADGRAHWRPLTLGIAGEDAVEARSGVAAGEAVATTGRSSLADGMAARTSVGKP